MKEQCPTTSADVLVRQKLNSLHIQKAKQIVIITPTKYNNFSCCQVDLRKVRNYLLTLVNDKCEEIKYFLAWSSNFNKRGEKTEDEGRKRAQKINNLLGRKIGLCLLAVSVLT